MNAEPRGELTAKPTDGFIDDPSGDDFATAAKWALQNKNWRLALEQAAAAAALDATHEPYLKLLDDAIRAARAPLELLKLPPSGAFYGLCAARGRALARAERFEEALEHVLRAACFSPVTPFVPWAVGWVANAKVARRLNSQSLALHVIELSEAARKIRPRPGSVKNLEAALEIVKLVRERNPTDALVVAGSRVLRALGRVDDAVAALERGDGEPVTWEIASERAAIERERHDPAAQISWLQRALLARPGDVASLVDLGEALLADGSLDEARLAFAEARAIDSADASALLGEHYATALARGASRLGIAHDCSEWNETQKASAARRAHDLASYATRLADPVDPLIGVIRGVLENVAAEAAARPGLTEAARVRVSVRADRRLSPSARLALKLGLARLRRTGDISVDAPQADTHFGPLWDASQEPPAPSVPSPAAGLVEAVAQLARQPFDWDAWRRQAGPIANRLGPATARSIIEAMAHVPAPAEGADPALWVHGFQCAAALIASATGEPSAVRFQALRQLLVGVDDWSAAAGLLGLRSLIAGSPELAPALRGSIADWLRSPFAEGQPSARLLAVVGSELEDSDARRAALRLRARIMREQSETRA